MSQIQIPAPKNIATLVELLRWRAGCQPDELALSFLPDGERDGERMTYGDIDRRARVVAVRLRELGAKGERVLLVYPPGLHFVAGFFGCLYARAVAVPVFPPPANRPAPRLEATIASAQPALALCTAKIKAEVDRRADNAPYLSSLRWVVADEFPADAADSWRDPGVGAEDLAFLQYTSGSTASPRGVMLTHANLLHNLAVIARGFDHPKDSARGVSWLPFYHDMGLIGGIMQSLYVGGPSTLMPPVAFLSNPSRWLKAISDFRATCSGGPNFAYAYCVRKITDEEKATLDLRSWELAYCGAEPVRADTLDRFAEAFAPCGFRREAFYPCYGLAESTLMVTGGQKGSPVTLSVRKSDLQLGKAVPVASADANAQTLVGCGRPQLGQEVVIADPRSKRRCNEFEIGEIWTAGSSVAQGYWNQPEETEKTFGAHFADGAGPYLRTGDLGFLHHGELFITGRLKDVIIIQGRNHYPQDIEATIEKAHSAIRTGCVAAFTIESGGEEQIVAAAELEREFRRGDPAPVLGAVREAIALQHGLYPRAVVLLRTGSIPMTSSGKVQRFACRDAFKAGTLDEIARWSAEPAPSSDGGGSETQVQPPAVPAQHREELEAFTIDAIAAALGRDRSAVSIEQPLLQLGMDSLTAVELKARIESRFGVTVPFAALLHEGASIRSLVDALLEQKSQGATREPATHQETPTWPLTATQRAMWFLQHLEPESTVHVIQLAARIAGPLNAEAMRRAFQSLIERHSVLRSGFRGQPPVQDSHAHPNIDFQVIDTTDWTLERLQSARDAESRRPFNLERDPLLRLRLFRGPNEVVLLLTIHHLISDHRSLQVMVADLAALYAAECEGKAANLPALSCDYGDFVRWQEGMLAGSEGEQHWAYWRERLAGDPPALNLPTDRPRPAFRSSRGGTLELRLNPELAEGLRELARTEGVTLFTLALAGFQVLLHRYSGQDDILVGSPAAARGRPEFERLAGYFTNMVVLRGELSSDPPFRQFLRQMQQRVVEALEHQDFPFPLLVERLRPAYDPGRNPLFQVAFGVQKSGSFEQSLRLGDLSWSTLPLNRRVANFDLDVTLHDQRNRLAVTIQFNTELFNAESVERMWRHYEFLLGAIVTAPERRLSEMPLIGDDERRLVVSEWNRTESELPIACIHRLFAKQAGATPDAPAVIQDEQVWTYRQINERANHLARRLCALGVGPESIVGLVAKRIPETIAAMLAVLKAGGAYLPLDPTLPRERLALMIEDVRPAVVLTPTDFKDRLPAGGGETVCLDGDWGGAAPIDGGVESAVGLNNLACVIFTSGSTGRPKGVLLEHRSIANYALSIHSRFGLTPEDRLLQIVSLSFDGHLEEIFGVLTCGATLVLRTESTLDSPTTFWRKCRKWGVTIAAPPTAFWHELAAAVGPGVEPPPGLRLLVLGGERLSPDRLARWRRQVGNRVRLLNTYGPTEATVVGVERDVTDWESVGEVPIGRPIANVRAYVLDAGLQPCPIGVPGELCLAGTQLARGYLNRPELTAERFLEVFKDVGESERVYRTGDRARWLPSGELEFLGRLDDQVKVRGFRVEPAEIETRLAEHPGVREAAVVAVDGEGGRRALHGYFVSANGPAPGAGELRDWLKARLPEYMVPATFTTIPDIPRTPGGKVDRRALPAPDESRSVSGRSFVAPRSAAEKAIADIWREVLGVERIGVHDGFFELGGHSLLAVQVASRVRERLGVDLPLRNVFEEPTVASLAKRVESGRGAAPLPPIERVARTGQFPLSFAQERLWFLDQLEPHSAAYNVPGIIRLHGAIEPGALERALSEIIRRHQALRTTFRSDFGRPVQIIGRPPSVTLNVEDVNELALGRIAEEEARRPFDLEYGPLLRVRLLRLHANEYVLLATMHHIVADGWSVDVLLREMETLYEAFSHGRPSPLPELPVQYLDFACWQRNKLCGDQLEQELARWKEQLCDLPALELPTDRPRPAMQTFRGASQHFELPANLARSLQELAEREKATLFMALLASFQALIHRYTGQDDFAVGSPVAGRDRPELEGLIGFFVNAVALRADLGGEPTFRTLLGRVRETTLNTFAHQAVPFEKLVEALKPPRDASRNPLFQVLLALQNSPREHVDSALRPELTEIDTGTAKFDISLYVEEFGDALRGRWEFNTDLFDAATIHRLHGHWLNLLNEIVADPDRTVFELPILGSAERQQLLVEWNNTAVEFPLDDCLHHVFEDQAARTPEAIALIGEKSWTCRELNEEANQLAYQLRARGVGPEALVGVCVERSSEMVLALLATLKAGGAYVPLDPSYPQDRLTFMLEDAHPRVVLTQKRLHDRLPETGAEIVCVDDDAAASGRSRHNLPRLARPDHAAYVMYTSGSTGQPKGVIGTHRATLNCLHWMWRDFPFRQGEICCQKTPFSFGDSIQEIFGPLLKGIPLAVIPDRDVKQPARLARTLASQRVTRIVLVPSLLRMLLAGVPNLAEQLPFLTLWIASGETLDLDLAERFERSLPHATLVNMYGCSELSNDVTWCDTKGCRRLGYLPIGKPTANMRVYILDERQQPVPLGVPGELCVAGAGVNRGYLNRPELTAEKFIPDPYGPAGSRLYRTGDRARWRADGNLEYLGRLDHQVKIRGMRVELGEIEAALSAHPDVTQAVAIIREDQPGHPRLAAYITARDGKPRYDALRRFLATRLPEYMMPSAIVVLDGFPSTPSGKVDRNALPVPSIARPELSQRFVAPRSDGERILAGIWAELLHLERVGVDDNFFELGGDSILAVQMIARARDAGLSLAPKDLFQQQTVAELAALVEQNRSQVSAPPHDLLVPMHPGEDRPPLFCIHPIEGTVFGYAALARLLDNGQPVWGIRARGLEPDENPSQSLPVMSDEYVGAIKSVQPEGPYYLCGWSMGGLLAYEIARRLHGNGNDIAFLAVLDQGPRPDIRLISALAERLDAKPLAFMVEPSDSELAQLRNDREIAHWLPAGLDEAEINQHLRVYLRNWAALQGYTAPSSDEHIWLFRARERADRDETLGWAAVAHGGVEVQTIPGDHRGMMQFPHAAILARELRQCLEVVFQESGNKPALSWK